MFITVTSQVDGAGYWTLNFAFKKDNCLVNMRKNTRMHFIYKIIKTLLFDIENMKVQLYQSLLNNPVFDNPVLLTNPHKTYYQMATNVKILVQIDSIIQSIQ